ncbi:MAG: hypothetical protein ACYTE6_02205 [Planctomycetota bacterium]|jgi:hypothetical protein
MAALAVLLAISTAMSFPRPAPVAPRWELEFEPGALRLYVDPHEGEAYWYFTYMVTNRTGRDQVWAPTFALFTDAGEILASGRGVPSRVAADIRTLLGNEFLEHQNEIIGEIFHGRDHAKEGLVIWPAQHLEVNEVSLFIAGMSGETASVVNPVTGERVLLRKTLQRDYLIPGDAIARGSKPVELRSQRWVMR